MRWPLLDRLRRWMSIGATYADWDDFWYRTDPRWMTTAGVGMTPEGAMRLSAVYACVGLLSDMVGTLPLIVYRRRPDDGKDRATTHPLYRLLRRQPNARQTAFEWRKMGMAHLLLRGNFYNRIVLDGRGAVTALEPLHPHRTTVRLLENGRRGYLYRLPTGETQALTQDDVFHTMGLTLDGVTGCSVIEWARENLGRAWAADTHAARFWRNHAQMSGVLKYPGNLNKPQREALREEYQQAQTGENAFKFMVVEGGGEFTPIGMTSRDAQFVETLRFGVSEIARWFRVPPHMIGDVDRSTSWGSGIEQQSIGFVNFTLMPWLVAVEQAADRDLIQEDRFFAEFLVDALLRGDLAARAAAYSQFVMNGIMSENEVRVRENLNPWPGLDEPRRSVNQDRGGDPRLARRPRPPEPEEEEDDEEEEPETRARQIIRAAATRTVRKEIAAVTKWAPRYADDAAAWRAWVLDFYDKHQATLEEVLALAPALAQRYVVEHTTALLTCGLSVLTDWHDRAPTALAAMALGESGYGEER